MNNQKGRVTIYTSNLFELDQVKANTRWEKGVGVRASSAEISGNWQVRVLSAGARKQLEFCGLASTRVELYESDKLGTRLAKWNLDLGVGDAPGCYVHAQIPWGFDISASCHKPIPVPRLPSIFVTPMSAVEFVLGELFQDEWKQRTSKSSGDNGNWHRLQKNWLQCLFSWYLDELDEKKKIEVEETEQEKCKKEKKKKRKKRKGKGKKKKKEEKEEKEEKRKEDPSFSPWITIKTAEPDGRLFAEYRYSRS